MKQTAKRRAKGTNESVKSTVWTRSMSSSGKLPNEQPWKGVESAGEYTPHTPLHREHPCTRDGQSEATELLLKHMKAECEAFEE